MALAPDSRMTAAACAALGVYGVRACNDGVPGSPRRRQFAVRGRDQRQALTAPQRRIVLDLLHAPRFADQAPSEIYASLLDDGVYHCAIPTMYRILGQNGKVRERREQRHHPAYRKPELLAEQPDEDFVLDIAKLMGPTRWRCFYLLRHPRHLQPPRGTAGASPMRRAPLSSSHCSTTPSRSINVHAGPTSPCMRIA